MSNPLSHGYGLLDKNPEAAFQFFLDNCKDNNVEANFMTGQCFATGTGVTTNQAKAFEYHLNAANLEHGYAQMFVGEALLYGRGTIKDEAEAFVWLSKSLANGAPLANLEIGRLYLLGLGVEKNLESSLKALEACAELVVGDLPFRNGNDDVRIAHAQYLLAIIYGDKTNFPNLDETERLSKLYDWYLKAAENGSSFARAWMIFTFGRRSEDEVQSLDAHQEWRYYKLLEYSADLVTKLNYLNDENPLYVQSLTKEIDALLTQDIEGAKRGEAIAEFWMATRYIQGFGVEINLDVAFDFSLRSANQHFTPAEIQVGGLFFLDGYAGKKNLGEAHKYLTRATELDNDPRAHAWLGQLYETAGEYQDFEKAINHYERVNDRAYVQLRLGYLRELGKGCEKSLSQAKNLYLKATLSGNKEAIGRLAVWHLLGIDGSVNTAEAQMLLDKVFKEGYADLDAWSMLLYIEKKFTEKHNEVKEKSKQGFNEELFGRAFECTKYCWDICDEIAKEGYMYSDEVKQLICNRGFRWMVWAYEYGESHPDSSPTYKWSAERDALKHLTKLAKIQKTSLSYQHLYRIALNLRVNTSVAETAEIYLELAKAGVPACQYWICPRITGPRVSVN